MKIELTYVNPDFDGVNVAFKLDGVKSGTLRLKHKQVNDFLRVIRFGFLPVVDSLSTIGSRSPSTTKEK